MFKICYTDVKFLDLIYTKQICAHATRCKCYCIKSKDELTIEPNFNALIIVKTMLPTFYLVHILINLMR